MTRLLFVAVDAWHFSNHQIAVALAARQAGYDVAVAAGVDRFAPRVERAGLSFLPLPLAKTRSPIAARRAMSAMEACFRAWRPDLVQLSSLRVAALGSGPARRAAVPAVVRVVTGRGYTFTGGSAVLRWVVGRLWHGAPANAWTVFQNEDDRQLFVSRGWATAERSSRVPGAGVDLQQFNMRPEPPGPPVLLYLGRLLRSKGIPELVEAARLLRRRGMDFRLQLAGEPDPGNPQSLRAEELQSWHEAGEVEWLGFQEDPAELLAACAALVLPTRYGEGLPRVLLEAAACGRPAVATDSPGCRDAIVHERTGLLVPPGEVEALADALARLVTDAELRQRLGRAARARAEAEFDQRQITARYLELYVRLAPPPPPPPPPPPAAGP